MPLLLASIACGQAQADREAPPQAPDGPLRVIRGPLAERVVLTGELEAAQATVIAVPRSPTWQTQIRWIADDGGRVARGDKVLELDNSSVVGDLDDKRLEMERKAIELEQRTAELESQLEEKELAVEQARLEADKARLEAEVPEELLSRHEHQQRQLALEKAGADLEKARADLVAFRRGQTADLEVLRIELAKLERDITMAEQTITAYTVHAPEDGLFLVEKNPWEERKLQVGDMVWVGMTLATIPELASLGVRAWLPDVDDRAVAVGDAGTCRLDTYSDKAIACRVNDVGAVAQQPDTRSARRAFRVWLELERVEPRRMRPGMSVQVAIDRPLAEEALLVPRAALDLAADPPRARLAGGSWRKVELGPCAAMACVARSGLEEGQELARVP
ncbi:MAG: HlyD family secretion protein [Thermoanaerobaculia bacterium]